MGTDVLWVQNHLDESRIVRVRTELPEPPLRFVGRLPELTTLTGRGNRPVHVAQGMAGSGQLPATGASTRTIVLLAGALIASGALLPPGTPNSMADANRESVARAVRSYFHSQREM